MRASNIALVSLLSWLIAIGTGFGLAAIGLGQTPFVQAENLIKANLTHKSAAVSLNTPHPRLTPAIQHGEDLTRYLAIFRQSPNQFCQEQRLTSQITCLALTGHPRASTQLQTLIEAYSLSACTAAGNKNDAWRLAIALDQLKAANPNVSYKVIEEKLKNSLQQCLDVLDASSASLWHGRFSLGAEAFIVAASLYDEGALLERAFYHFKQSVLALALTEGWPGGFNYWVQNRGLTFYLAVNTYLQSGDDKEFKAQLQELALRNGLWHIYMTRPDGRVQASGDEGSRTDLKEESKKVLDLIARITQDPAIATFADYIQHQHGRDSYYRTDHWLIPFTFDPGLDHLPADKGLAVFDGWLPNQAIFGRHYLNQIILRTGWKSDDSYVLINGGQQFSHHQHADAGHFTYMFEGEPVAVDGAVYDSILSDFRLNYGIRSNAKNLLNVSFADTDYQPSSQFKTNQQDGSQHLSMPHGSAIRSVEHWLQETRRSNKYKRAEIQHYTTNETAQVILDLTPAYLSGGTTGNIIREFTFSNNGRLQITDSVKQTGGILLSHLNLPGLERNTCVDSNQAEQIPLSDNLRLTINTQGIPACDTSFAAQFFDILEKQLSRQQELAKGKAWSDGPFHVLTGAVQTNQGKARVVYDFQPLE